MEVPIVLKIGNDHVLRAKLIFDIDIQQRFFDGVRDVGDWHITPHSEMDKRLWSALTEKRFPDFVRLLADIMESKA